jgi:hypothetical protein
MRTKVKNYKSTKLHLNKKTVAVLTLNDQQAKLIAGGGIDIIRTTTSKDKICTTLTQLCTGSNICEY